VQSSKPSPATNAKSKSDRAAVIASLACKVEFLDVDMGHAYVMPASGVLF
jgi:hypothetical protein